MPKHGPHRFLLIVDHAGDVQLGGCPECMQHPEEHAQELRDVLLEAARFIASHPAGRHEL